MDGTYEELELARWQAMLGSVTPSQVVTRDVIEDAKLGAKMAWGAQRALKRVIGTWFNDFNAVKDKVGWTSNEGWYIQQGTAVMKKLDVGHKGSDLIESTRIALGKLFYSYEEQSINYSAPWKYMRLLSATKCGWPADHRLVGAHGGHMYPGTYMFVICGDGCIRYFPNYDEACEPGQGTKHYLQYLPHAALAEHEAVLAAGNFYVDAQSRLLWAASNSGHYRVDDRMCRDNLKEALKRLGYEYEVAECRDAQSMVNMAELHGMAGGARPPNVFMYLHFRACGPFQEYMKTALHVAPQLDIGVRRTRTELVTTIKKVLSVLKEQNDEADQALLPVGF